MKTYELVIGRPVFEAFRDEYSLIPQFKKVIGGVPEDWIPDAFTSGVLKEEPDGMFIVHFTTMTLTRWLISMIEHRGQRRVFPPT